jgi:hypothetical protein
MIARSHIILCDGLEVCIFILHLEQPASHVDKQKQCITIAGHALFKLNALSSGVARFFWRPGRVITMAAPNRNYEFKKSHALFIFLLLGLVI